MKTSAASQEEAGDRDIWRKAIQDFLPHRCQLLLRLRAPQRTRASHKDTLDGDETVTMSTPQPFHIAIPRYVTAACWRRWSIGIRQEQLRRPLTRAENREPEPIRRPVVTASLKVDYLKPTPLECAGNPRQIVEIKGRKVS